MSGDHNEQKDKSFECPRCGRCCTDQYERGFVDGMQRQMQLSVDKALNEKRESVAWADMAVRGEDKGLSWTPGHFHKTPLYTAPPKQWVGLTDEELEEMHNEIKVRLMGTYRTEDIYRSIEAKLKEKNT
jgi:Fe-S-cluster containining protein